MSDKKCWRLLTLNCHEAWVHQLGYLDARVDIIDGLPNRYTPSWDTHVRPVPANARLISLEAAHAPGNRYDCVIAHNMTDLMDVKLVAAARIIVFHATLEGRLAVDAAADEPQRISGIIRRYLTLTGGIGVAVSSMKGRSWGFPDDVVPNGVDCDAYLPWSGEVAAGVRVANQIQQKRRILAWDFHERAFADLPVTIVGHNPEMPGVAPSESWDDLKGLLRRHRFFIHTAHPDLEDGYNMASLEAMAAGLPILGNRHPTSPVVHGVSGFLAETPDELNGLAKRLIDDRELAAHMGEEARRQVRKEFDISLFSRRFHRAIDKAVRQYRRLGKGGGGGRR
ncbi:MAG: glycosyltransferase family 4 protein [Magnetococcales bacterium]|nr:glycosyltransferase family 4 protein [Magnetococcales bacterium]MBF0155934.1 glycosyltransferase family 4 protein [Magnetococcales bacterium]